VRRGRAGEAASGLSIDGFRLGSGRRWRELQLCDLISNASHDDLRKCGRAAAAALRDELGVYDFGLTVSDLCIRVDACLAEDSLGLAVQALAERLAGRDEKEEAPDGAAERLERVLDRLARLGAPARDPQLRVLVSWLEQLVELRRTLELGYRVARWLLEQVADPLAERVVGPARPTLDWFSFAVHRLALTACNHRGALEDARTEHDALVATLPRVAGQWEHATTLMEGLAAQAVHLTDCMEHAKAADLVRPVAEYYGVLSDLLHDALPAVFPDRVRSELRGKALGTWLQAEMYAGLVEPARIAEARRISDLALEEFLAPADVARQQQYRCQLETYAGRFAEARRRLAASLGAVDETHAAIGASVAGLEGVAQGFSLLHWLRLGAAAFRAPDETDEADAFRAALRVSKLLSSPWCTSADLEYPAQGIARQLALLHAATGDANAALSALGRLRSQDAFAAGRHVFLAIQVAACAETAALLWSSAPSAARRLCDSKDRERPGLLQVVARAKRAWPRTFPALGELLETWERSLDAALRPGTAAAEARRHLLEMARPIGY